MTNSASAITVHTTRDDPEDEAGLGHAAAGLGAAGRVDLSLGGVAQDDPGDPDRAAAQQPEDAGDQRPHAFWLVPGCT